MVYNEVMWSRFVDHDMVMQCYLGHAVGHTYTHGSNLLLPVRTTWVMPEYEDMLVPSDCGDGEESSSGSEEDSEMMSTESDAMDIGNVLRVLRGEMPELTGAEEMAKAELAWELIYKLGNYSKWE